MEKFIIAGLKTKYRVRYDFLGKRSEPYKADFDDSETDMIIDVTDECLMQGFENVTTVTIDKHEYIWTGQLFNRTLLEHNGIMLHSSCVEKDGYAYLFSADSGTGKSTHTHLWLKNLSGTRIINDDKPALILDGDTWYACGTPFSGKNDENLNVMVPVRAIVFLERAETNYVEKITVAEATKRLVKQTIRPIDMNLAYKMLEMVDLLLRRVPVFLIHCNMDDEAAKISYESIERLIKDES